MRLLYVAMTRARDTLILTGSVTENKWETLWAQTGAITVQKIVSAKSYADWLGLWFGVQSPRSKTQSPVQGELPNLRWRIADDTELAGGWGEAPGEPNLVDGHPGPRGRVPHPLEALDDETLTWEYGFGAAKVRSAKSSVTALRREAGELDDEAEQVFPAQRSSRSQLSATEAGTAHHKFLQHVSLENAGELAALETEAGRLESKNILSAEERAALDLPAIAAFWNSPAGRNIREQPPEKARRELAFTARFSPAELGAITGRKPDAGLEDEFIVVQGVADLAVLLPEEIWLGDFKTDDVRAEDLPEKTKLYEPQLKLYASALGRIYSKPVTHCWLHFLSARQTVKIET